MFHARIVSPRGSLYLAAEATPYDLENLRTHVHDLWGTSRTETRLELRIDRPSNGAAYKRVSELLRQLEAEGVQTTFSLTPSTDAPTAAQARANGTRPRALRSGSA